MKKLKNQQQSLKAHSQAGFSLMVVLGFVGLITSIIAFTVMENRGAVQQEKARAAGWHAAKIARAARIYVRDNSITALQDFHASKLDGVSVEIDIDDIIGAGLLPEDFSDTNILGQEVEIYAALSPINGQLGTAGDSNAVPTAYVYIPPISLTRNQPQLVQEIVTGAKQSGLYVDAPVFDSSGNVVSDDCNGDGNPDVVLWDTGCLDAADFTTITSADFEMGALLVPSWRTSEYDNRAIMRFPQPENPGHATMLTTLEMAPPVLNASGECADFVELTVPDNAGGFSKQPTALCNVQSDLAAADNRVDIVDVNRMEALTFIAAKQGAVETTSSVDNYGNTSYAVRTVPDDADHVVKVTGDVNTASHVWVSSAEAPSHVQINGGLAVDHNITVSNRSLALDGPGTPGIAVTNDASLRQFRSAGDLNGQTITVDGATGASNYDVAGAVTIDNDCGGAECGLVADNLQIGGNTTVNDTAVFMSGFGSNDVTVTDTDKYATNAILVKGTGAATIGGNVVIDSSLTSNSSTRITGGAELSVPACLSADGCPDVKRGVPETPIDYGEGQ